MAHSGSPADCPMCTTREDREAHTLLAQIDMDLATRADCFEHVHEYLVKWKRGEKPWPTWNVE